MNDLIPRACCHISDKNGRNENRSVLAPVFIFVMQPEFAQALYIFASHFSLRLLP
jgi:hypothetical protein